MPSEQINLTIGTAGHIDHGKTALVKCLTGCDTDRLKAEKERGMSIDLGFAPCTIGDTEVGIVDVPGHENFIKTMVAGACGMDAVILVVAADDGVMPQTREHLDILTLLGVQHGMVALTKIDRVDDETRELAQVEILEYLRETFLEGAPILPVSSVTLEGFDAFYEALFELMDSVHPKPTDGVFRLPLDRAFSIKGHGTVVSGIPVTGAASLDDELELLPQRVMAQVRGVEVYGRASDTVQAGQCAALNLRHVDHRSIRRGNTLTAPGYFTPQQWFVCALRMLRQGKVALKNGANVKFHTGTAEVNATVYSMSADNVCSGEERLIQIRTTTPVVAGPRDRFILRTLSPVRTVGGGMIVEAVPGRLRRRRPRMLEDLQERAQAVAEDNRFVEYCVRTAPASAASDDELAVRTKLPRKRTMEITRELIREGRFVALGPKLLMHADVAGDACRRVLGCVEQFHQQSPESLGMTLDQLREMSGLDRRVVDGVIELLRQEDRIVEQNGRLATADHRVTLQDDDAVQLALTETMFREQPFHPPSVEEIAARIGADEPAVRRLLKILREHGKLVPVGEGLLFHREAVQRAQEILTDYVKQEGKLESVRFKYLLDTTRKFAIPLLDHFDRVGVTRRDGNTRYLKQGLP